MKSVRAPACTAPSDNMAAVSEDISDRELRAKLKENGISCGPLTATTKNLYIRKLNKKLSERENSSSSTKLPSRNFSPKPSQRRASPRRRSVDPTPAPGRKLIGFSSDEDESDKVPVPTRQKRLPGEFSSRKSTASRFSPVSIKNEERPVRRRPHYTSSPKEISKHGDDRTNSDEAPEFNSYAVESKRGKLPSYVGLRNLFLRKSMEDSRHHSNAATPQATITYDLEVEDEIDGEKLSPIWVLIIILLVVFILVFYWQILSTQSWHGTNNDQLKICGTASRGDEDEKCLTEGRIVQRLVEKLQYDLGTREGAAKCGYSTESGRMTREELKKWVNEQEVIQRKKDFNTDKILNSITEQIIQVGNPMCIYINGTIVTNGANFHALIPMALKPLTCRIREAFSRVFYQLLFLCGAIICCLCIYFAVKYRWMLRERRTRQMFDLVDKILEVLKNHHNECQRNKELSPYLAIPHVRDMLIKPSERESMKSAWDNAVKFLSAQESRVRVESQRISGEDFEVWRLLHHTTPGSSSSPTGSNVKQGKVWTGRAFENFTTAVNPPLISPTPCLKIRNMFEPVMETQDQWHVFIQDAILEKCTEKEAAIVHISVDKSSNEGCVYVKCADHRSSGAAFRAIHGCWFDGRLVTVKFLTLKRYHQRFPESVDVKEHLKPSGMSSSTIPKFESAAPVNESDSDSDS